MWMQLQSTALVCILGCCLPHRALSFTLEPRPKDRPCVRSSISQSILENNHREKKIMVNKRIIQSPLFRLLKNSTQDSPANGSSTSFATTTALVILNAPIREGLSPLLRQLWEAASLRVCADGGANRLRWAAASGDDEEHYIPHVITGDLDSLTAANRAYYEQRGVQILPVIDQDRNDLDKAIAAVLDRFSGVSTERIQCVVYGAFGGRFDQEMASMQALYRWQQEATKNKMDLFLYDDNTMAFLLPAGETSIELALPNLVKDEKSDGDSPSATANMVAEGPTCGLIPLGGPVESATTTGLQWNLDHQETKFGGLVSTSNRCVENVVTVECSDALIFTAEIHSGVTSSWSEG